ncbi:CCD81 protein, partial [Heliornis fulica]|nr:CCD81 protein [Heliornis fulica]
GNKVLEPVKYGKVAAAASVSLRKVEACMQGTVSLLSHCLGKGKNIAFVLKDVGVLLIENRKVQMKFYHTFLEKMLGKENLAKALKLPQMLKVVLSPVGTLTTETTPGCLLLFPEFELQSVAKPPARVLPKA